jgi:hypothetical protein
MDIENIAQFRLSSQQIVETELKSVKELVAWMGAMQAQDYNMAKWAIGVRLPHAGNKIIESAITNGDIIRTHVLRPTWHFISPDDIYWMLELTAPHIKSAMKSRNKELGLTEAIYNKSNRLIEKSLTGVNHLTREEIMTILEKAKIVTEHNRSSHFLMQAELDRIICSGAPKGNKQTYALLEERVPKRKTMNKDEALATLAQKYFTSHCPATLQDFIWWSGLPISNARHALEMIKSNFISETVGMKTYWITNSFAPPVMDQSIAFFLPAYDEYLISYKDRSASLPFQLQKNTVSSNGIFHPVIILNGKVIGVWNKKIKNDKVEIKTKLFQKHSKTIHKIIEKAAEKFGNFIGADLNLKFKFN